MPSDCRELYIYHVWCRKLFPFRARTHAAAVNRSSTSDDLCVPAVRLYLLWDVVPSLSLARVFGTHFLPTSPQHLPYSLSKNV